MVVNTSLESGEDASAIIKGGNEEEGKGFCSAEVVYQVTTLFP